MKINGVVQLKHPLKSVDAKCTVHWKTRYFTLLGIVKRPIFNELRSFRCKSYPITQIFEKSDNRTQEGSLMVHNNSKSTMKWWNQQTNKINYCSSVKFYENKEGLATMVPWFQFVECHRHTRYSNQRIDLYD